MNSVHWLHIPKTGTAFLRSIMISMCPQNLNFLLSENRPMFPDAMQTIIARRASTLGKKIGDMDNLLKTYCLVSPNFTWRHAPLTFHPTSRDRVITFLRPAEARLRSAYSYRMHGIAWKDVRLRTMLLRSERPFLFFKLHQCGLQTRMIAGLSGVAPTSTRKGSQMFDVNGPSRYGSQYGSEWQLRRGIGVLYSRNSSAFVKYLLTLQNKLSRPSKEDWQLLELSKRRLDAFWFIGFTDRWAESVHKFHKLLGIPAKSVEFMRLKDKRIPEVPICEPVIEFDDWMDEELYEYARAL